MKRTTLVLEGVAPDEVTADLLVAVLDVSEERDLNVVGVGVNRKCSGADTSERS